MSLKLLPLGVALCGVTSVQAINTVFEFGDDTTIWGEWSDGVNEAGYSGPFSDYTNTGRNVQNGIQNNEGPIDGQAAIFSHSRGVGTSTWISDGVDSPSAGLGVDLSEGNSLTFRFAYNFLANRNANNGSYAAPNSFSLFDIGVTSGSDVFGSSADSFFISAVPTSIIPVVDAGGALTDVTGAYSLHGFTEDSINGTGNGTAGGGNNLINVGGGSEFVSGLALDSVGLNGGRSETTHGDGTAYTYELTFSNVGSGNFEVIYDISQFTISGSTTGATVAFDGTVASGSSSFAHGINEADLADIAIGVGHRTLSANVPVSGTTFDNFATLNNTVPEPSVALLAGLSSLIFVRRRRR